MVIYFFAGFIAGLVSCFAARALVRLLAESEGVG